ncbi:MAG: hypothetical protein U0930_15290 [Pirellulales bacterium]
MVHQLLLSYLVPTAILAVFAGNARLADDLKSLYPTIIVGITSVVGLFMIRLKLDRNWMRAVAFAIWWVLVYVTSCLLPLGFYIRKQFESFGFESLCHLVGLLTSSTLALLLWFFLSTESGHREDNYTGEDRSDEAAFDDKAN